MDKEDFEYITTILKSTTFDRTKFENDMNLSLTVTHSLKDTENGKSLVNVIGELKGENSEGESAVTIEMISEFNTDSPISEEDLKKLEEEDENYLQNPLLNEISLMFGTITGKSFKVPIILPFHPSEKKEMN